MTVQQELDIARQLPGTAGCAAIRDIPQSCTCGGWQYRTSPARWILPVPDNGCPWHHGRRLR